MERLMATRHPYTLLDTQYRMHPDISCFPSVRFYAGRVKDATGMAARAGLATNPLGTTGAKEAWLGPYTVVDVASGCEARAASGSLHNDAEAEMVVLLVRAVRDKCGERNVAVITFYAAQVTCISAALRRGGLRGVQVYTVDSFQGSEEEVVVLSFVRANPRGQKGFLDDFRRLNVALTRAKKALLMACHVDTLAKGGGDLAELMQDARIRGVVVHESVVRQQLAVRSSVPFKRRMGHSGAAGPAKLAVPPKEKRKLKRKMT
jgi:senataxin